MSKDGQDNASVDVILTSKSGDLVQFKKGRPARAENYFLCSRMQSCLHDVSASQPSKYGCIDI